MTQTIYGLTQSGNRYYYAMGTKHLSSSCGRFLLPGEKLHLLLGNGARSTSTSST